MEEVMPEKDNLPVVSLEVGDTWMYGAASDPLKMAQNRALQRTWIECLDGGEAACQFSDPVIQNMSFFLLKAPEHTWGTPGIEGWGSGDDYSVLRFRKNLTSRAYMSAAASWAEQRFFNELAVRALEEKDHPLAARARAAVEVLETVKEPDMTGYDMVAPGTAVMLRGGLAQLGLGSDGSITTLATPGLGDDIWHHWASEDSPLAAFVYKTFNETEWAPFTYAYCADHKEQGGFCKPGSNNYSESRLWRPRLTRLWVKGGISAAEGLVALLEMPAKAASTYGAPSSLALNVSLTEFAAGRSSLALDISLVTLGKQPTMIGEASSVTFKPLGVRGPDVNGSAWRIDKLGSWVDPEGVLDGGSQYVHGSWHGARAATAGGTFAIESLDAVNLNPITEDYPTGNPLPAAYKESVARAGKGLSRLAPGSVQGMAVNIHNNLWNTNYPLYYPYFDARYCSSPLACRDANSLWRFRMRLGDGAAAGTLYI